VPEAAGDRQAAITRAEGEKQANILTAEGNKQAAILNAEGERRAVTLKAEGYATALTTINQAASTLDARTMGLQYLDALKEMGSYPSTKFIFPLELIGLIIGIFIGIVNYFLLPNEVEGLYRLDNRESPVRAITGLWVLLPLIGSIIWFVKVQSALNEFWQSHGAPAP